MDANAIRVERHRSELGTWELATRPAHPALRAHVAGYCGYREDTPGAFRRREVPSAQVPLVISFGDPLWVGKPGGRPGRGVTSFAAGLHDRPVVTEHAGRQHGIEVLLTPLGAYTLLGVPMRELANQVVELEALLGDGAGKLAGRLAETPAWDERLALLDDALGLRLAAGPQPSPGRPPLGRARAGLRLLRPGAPQPRLPRVRRLHAHRVPGRPPAGRRRHGGLSPPPTAGTGHVRAAW
jgi:hypothetical protein